MKEVYVFDSTPLIYLGKVRRLEKMAGLPTRNIIPVSVYKEVVEEGKKRGQADAFYVEKLVEEHLFEVLPVPKKTSFLVENMALDNADKDVLVLAQELRGRAILDDENARVVAEIVGIPKGGSLFLLLTLLRKKVISAQEMREIIDAMIREGWYCSTTQYGSIVKEIERLSMMKK